MATFQKLTDHFLTCTVCTEVFKDPCTLECNHTFCRSCVVSFIKTKPDAVKRKSIPCPVCCKWTKVPNPTEPVEEWADEIKPIFLIQGLLDSFGPNSKDTTNCSHCTVRGETAPATFWCSVCDDSLCEKCVLIHQQASSTRSHIVDDLSTEVKVSRRRKVTCKEHPNEYIDFHCKDCRKAICQKCCIIYHRKCDSVVTLESEMEWMKSFLAANRDKLLKKGQEIRLKVEEKKSKTESIRKTQSDLKSEIKSTCEKLINIIKQKESKLLLDLDEATQKEVDQLRAAVKCDEMAIQMYQQQSELLDATVESDCAMDIDKMCKSWKSGSENETAENDRDVTFIWRRNRDDLIQAVNDLHLGEIDMKYERGLDVKKAPVLQDTTDVQVTGEKYKGCPADVVVMEVNGTQAIVVTDWNSSNRSLKSFYSHNNQPRNSKLRLCSQPWSLTQVKHNQVAVTIPYAQQLVIAEITPDIKYVSTIKTQKKYRGITTLSLSALAATSESPPCVDILDMSGNIIRSISLQTDQKHLIKLPHFLCRRKTGNLLVSDYNANTVVCLTQDGDVVFRYTGDGVLRRATGVTCTSSGDILVADYNLNSVVHLTESGQFVRKILTSTDGLKRPWGLTVDRHNKLYVCNSGTGVIKVYDTCKVLEYEPHHFV